MLQKDTYFASGLHWTDLIPGTKLKAWPAWADYTYPLGQPLGAYTQIGFVFKRQFEHATVELDCGTVAATIDWHPPPPGRDRDRSHNRDSTPDCSLNGEYNRAAGRCACDAAWRGTNCELMALAESPPGSDFDEPTTSTWGGSIIHIDPATAMFNRERQNGTSPWHMYASEMLGKVHNTHLSRVRRSMNAHTMPYYCSRLNLSAQTDLMRSQKTLLGAFGFHRLPESE